MFRKLFNKNNYLNFKIIIYYYRQTSILSTILLNNQLNISKLKGNVIYYNVN